MMDESMKTKYLLETLLRDPVLCAISLYSSKYLAKEDNKVAKCLAHLITMHPRYSASLLPLPRHSVLCPAVNSFTVFFMKFQNILR